MQLSPLAGWLALLSLAGRAAVVVTEDMPVDPDQGWLLKLSTQLAPSTALWAVVREIMVLGCFDSILTMSSRESMFALRSTILIYHLWLKTSTEVVQ